QAIAPNTPAGPDVRRTPLNPSPAPALPRHTGPPGRRLGRARLLPPGLLAEPLFHEGRSQCPMRRVGPAVAEQGSANRVPLAGLQHFLLVAWVGARLGAGQKACAQYRGLRPQSQDRNHAARVPDAAGGGNPPARPRAPPRDGAGAGRQPPAAAAPPASTPWAMMTSTPAAAARRASATEPT